MFEWHQRCALQDLVISFHCQHSNQSKIFVQIVLGAISLLHVYNVCFTLVQEQKKNTKQSATNEH